jgi:hypothetical protein
MRTKLPPKAEGGRIRDGGPYSSDPEDGPMNERITIAAVHRCDVVIFAWGAHPMAERKANFLRTMVSSYRPTAYCFGKTKHGAPKHPLYIKTGTSLLAF